MKIRDREDEGDAREDEQRDQRLLELEHDDHPGDRREDQEPAQRTG